VARLLKIHIADSPSFRTPTIARARDRMVVMAKLTLIYGMRLLPSEDIEEVGDATVKLSNGREAQVTSHVIEGSKEEIQKQLQQSIDAFFDLYPEI
jgi:hypothetical protein